mgnify:FL=1
MNGDVIIQRVCEHRLILKEASVFDFRFHDSKFQSIRAIDLRVVCPNFVFIFRRSRKVSKGMEMIFVNVFLGNLVLSTPYLHAKVNANWKNKKLSLNVVFNQRFYLASCF